MRLSILWWGSWLIPFPIFMKTEVNWLTTLKLVGGICFIILLVLLMGYIGYKYYQKAEK